MVLGPVNVMLVSKHADGHARARHFGQLDSAGESLVTLGIIVLEANLELDGLEEVALLLVVGVVEEGLHVGAHSGCGNPGLATHRLRAVVVGNLPTVILDMMKTVFQKEF